MQAWWGSVRVEDLAASHSGSEETLNDDFTPSGPSPTWVSMGLGGWEGWRQSNIASNTLPLPGDEGQAWECPQAG